MQNMRSLRFIPVAAHYACKRTADGWWWVNFTLSSASGWPKWMDGKPIIHSLQTATFRFSRFSFDFTCGSTALSQHVYFSEGNGFKGKRGH